MATGGAWFSAGRLAEVVRNDADDVLVPDERLALEPVLMLLFDPGRTGMATFPRTDDSAEPDDQPRSGVLAVAPAPPRNDSSLIESDMVPKRWAVVSDTLVRDTTADNL
jgi:hypothetical protein